MVREGIPGTSPVPLSSTRNQEKEEKKKKEKKRKQKQMENRIMLCFLCAVLVGVIYVVLPSFCMMVL